MYDTDVTVWSPEGRLLQVEYAMESVKQGSACVGLRSKQVAVIGALKRSVNELSSHQKKIMQIDNHIAIGIAGLTADARSLAKWMRNECLNYKYVYGSSIKSSKLMQDLADRHQRTTQTYVRRPYGVGLLVGTYDEARGPHLYQTCPSGNLYEYYASAIGARSQSARTYLEKYYESFEESSEKELILHALRALKGCVAGDGKLTNENGSVCVVSEKGVEVIENEELDQYLEIISNEVVEAVAEEEEVGEGEGEGAESGEAMETD